MTDKLKNTLNEILSEGRYKFSQSLRDRIDEWTSKHGDRDLLFHATEREFKKLSPQRRIGNRIDAWGPNPLFREDVFHFSEDPLVGADFLMRGGYIHMFRCDGRDKRFFHLNKDLENWSINILMHHLIKREQNNVHPKVLKEIERLYGVIKDKELDTRLGYEKANKREKKFVSEVKAYIEGVFLGDGYYGFSYTNEYEGTKAGAKSLKSYAVFDKALSKLKPLDILEVSVDEVEGA